MASRFIAYAAFSFPHSQYTSGYIIPTLREGLNIFYSKLQKSDTSGFLINQNPFDIHFVHTNIADFTMR